MLWHCCLGDRKGIWSVKKSSSNPKVLFWVPLLTWSNFKKNSPVKQKTTKMKKRSEGMETLRAGCSKAEPKILFHCRPLPGGVGQPKFNQLETVTTFTHKPSLVRIDAHAISSYRGNRPTNTHTNKQTHRQDWLQYSAPLSLARSVMSQMHGATRIPVTTKNQQLLLQNKVTKLHAPHRR